MSKTRVAVTVVTIIYIVGFFVFPAPEKEDSNLLMRLLWPVVACVELMDGGGKEQP